MARLYCMDPRSTDALEVVVTKQLELETIRFAQRLDIDKRVLMERSNVAVLAEAEHMAIRMMHYVYGQRAEETVRFPATWWDAFKLRFFPRWRLGRWALRRWPAQHTSVTVKAMALFPALQGRGLRNQHIVYRAERSE